MTLELGRTPSQSEVFGRTYTHKEDWLWVDKRAQDVNDAFAVEKKRLEEEHQAIIDEEELWTWILGGRKRGKIYGMGLVPLHSYPPLFGHPDDDDTATNPPDLRKQVTLLNRDISQQAEAHAQKVAVVEAVCEEKVRTLETIVQSQSQEVSELRKAYSEMYSFLTQMRSSGSSSTMMPPPPPPARSRSPPPQLDRGTSPLPRPRVTPIMFETFSLCFICILE
ncbi:hypothetical protein PIB30_079802 [Stylosanthes scabra]|uniref:Uncharacterized protein n=1 Tax=Stylosanthes scabra TaxID=79078 RepID=A0ABU6VSF7_9FABA|nr:hypothetical protein [Stylosanthes scabra]